MGFQPEITIYWVLWIFFLTASFNRLHLLISNLSVLFLSLSLSIFLLFFLHFFLISLLHHFVLLAMEREYKQSTLVIDVGDKKKIVLFSPHLVFIRIAIFILGCPPVKMTQKSMWNMRLEKKNQQIWLGGYKNGLELIFLLFPILSKRIEKADNDPTPITGRWYSLLKIH